LTSVVSMVVSTWLWECRVTMWRWLLWRTLSVVERKDKMKIGSQNYESLCHLYRSLLFITFSEFHRAAKYRVSV
jgi:hypothetical protein